ncbi:unnamed protein product [Callosobruchus maculatus]|uniref:Pseudouridylate synthase 1 homolog n=1 Tax=Callosobruchus maculatus TaxID=64391 RepID=A0A653DK75_CALMS|nr:unnamed protein product [Callosobruchus maculatus]
MFKTYMTIHKQFFTSAFILKQIATEGSIQIKSNMNGLKPFLKPKYDGRSKKRQWEERRFDKGESIGSDQKKPKINEAQTEPEQPVEKIKRRKFALLMGYSGVNYFGMQRNPLTQTIEEDLFKALHKAGFINDSCYNQVQNMQFQRAARTDKGVSAVRQVVSLKLPENFDIVKVNKELPEQIRVFSYKRVTKGFNSKSQCSGRTYIYMLPTVAFADHNKEVQQEDFRLDEERLNRINELLKHFIGTKNYHNYTSKKKPNDPSAKRYIMSFVCEAPFIRNNVEFAILKVHGQSFMMHQIRKMVGLLLATVRGLATEDILQDSFKFEKINIPRAPGLGLVLEFVHYDRYNNRYGADGMHEKLTWEEVEDEVNNFKEKYIFPTIIEKEVNDKQMVEWINRKLSRHSYEEEEIESDDEVGGADDDEDDVKDNAVNHVDKLNLNKAENTG